MSGMSDIEPTGKVPAIVIIILMVCAVLWMGSITYEKVRADVERCEALNESCIVWNEGVKVYGINKRK